MVAAVFTVVKNSGASDCHLMIPLEVSHSKGSHMTPLTNKTEV
jgi:hypothetical protein